MSSERIPGFASRIDDYDCFVLDQWGVLHGGEDLYPGVLELLHLLHERGKRVIILTNSSKTAERNISRLEQQFGLGQHLYDGLVSSAQLLRDYLLGAVVHEGLPPWLRARVAVIAEDGDESLLDGTDVDIVDDPQDADFLFMLSISPTLDTSRFAEAYRRGITVLSPSADVHSVSADGVVFGMAEALRSLRSSGSHVINFGKPSSSVYRECTKIMGSVRPDRVLVVGDQLESDVAGAVSQNWHSVLVLTGAGEASNSSGGAIASPTYIAPSFRL